MKVKFSTPIGYIKSVLVFALLFGAFTFIKTPDAFAATKTWTGADPNDNNWSTAGNWSPSGAPANGDDLVFDVTVSGAPVADMSGLNVGSITYTNATTTAEIFTIRVSDPFTLSGDIETGTVGDLLTLNLDDATLTLGAQVDVVGSGSFNIDHYGVTTNNAVDLNSFTLGFNLANSAAAVRVPIVGSGTLNANTAGIINALVLRAANTYSGTTNINGDVSVTGPSPFGTSNVSVSTSGSIGFSATADTTISNQITMAGSNTINGLSFNGTPDTINYTLPNIILNGDVRFANYVATVNLTGIQANGHCATYYGTTGADLKDGAAHGFIGAPAGCLFGYGGNNNPSGGTPGVPNAGSENEQSLARVLIASAIIAGGLGLLAYKRHRLTASTRR